MRALALLALVACSEADAQSTAAKFFPRGCRDRSCIRDRVFSNARPVVDFTGGGATYAFAPLNGAGLPSACSTTAPTMTNGSAITFSRTGVAECISTNGQTITQLATGLPRVMSGAVDDPVLGLMQEGHARTNYAWRGHDLSNATWVKSNMTCTMTATGLRGTANSASRCTSTASNGTAIQTIGFSLSHEFSTSLYVRRVTGSGAVQVTVDGVTYLTDIASSLSTTLWKRYGPNQMVGCTAGTSANGFTGSLCITNTALHATALAPVVGIRLATSGDVVEVDFVQHEDGANATSPIETNGDANVDRNAELADMPISFNGSTNQWCASATVVIPNAGGATFRRVHGVPGDGSLGGADSTTYDDSYYNAGVLTGEFTANGSSLAIATSLTFGTNVRARTTTLLEVVQGAACIDGACSEKVLSSAAGNLDTWTRFRLVGFNSTNGAFNGVIKNVEFDPQGAVCQRFLDAKPTSFAAALGDSITCCPDGSDIGWPHYANITYAGLRQCANLAKGATKTADTLTRWTTYVRGKRYNHVFVLSGTNDIDDVTTPILVPEMEANLGAIFDQAVADGVRIHPITILPRSAAAGWTPLKQSRLEELNDWIRGYCASHGLVCIDAYNSDLRDGTALAAAYDSGDGLHPNVAGSTYLAGLVTAAVPLTAP